MKDRISVLLKEANINAAITPDSSPAKMDLDKVGVVTGLYMAGLFK